MCARQANEEGATVVTHSRRSHVPPRYALVIEWSDADQAYVVSFPEWDATGLYFVHTHGETYEEAVKHGQEVLTEQIALANERGKPLPTPRRSVASSLAQP